MGATSCVGDLSRKRREGLGFARQRRRLPATVINVNHVLRGPNRAGSKLVNAVFISHDKGLKRILVLLDAELEWQAHGKHCGTYSRVHVSASLYQPLVHKHICMLTCTG